MKKLKWICRYVFLSLLLASGIAWTVYCHLTVVQLEALAGSLEFIDMAVNRAKDAVAVLERIEQFKSLRETGVTVSAVMALCLCLLVLYHVFAPKLLAAKAARVKKERKPKQKPQKEVSPAPAVTPAQEVPAVETPAEEIPVVEAPAEEILIEDLPAVDVPAEKPADRVSFCPECGTRHEGAVAFCSNCGTRIP